MRLSSYARPPAVLGVLICFVIFSLVPPSLVSQQRPAQVVPKLNIAVLDFDTRGGLSRDEAATLSDAFQSQMVKLGEFTVVDRARIRQILDEQGFQQSEACSQVECIVEAGKILKVQRMFAGTIGKVGEVFSVSVMSIDIATAQIVDQVSRNHRGDTEDLLLELMPNIAREMAGNITGKRYAAPASGVSWVWYTLGTLVLGGGAAAAYFMLNKKETVQEEKLPSPPPLPQ